MIKAVEKDSKTNSNNQKTGSIKLILQNLSSQFTVFTAKIRYKMVRLHEETNCSPRW